jgi:hypothetical protein
MKIHVDTELEGLGEALSELLPGGATPTALTVKGDSVRLDARAPFVGGVALTAKARSAHGRLVLTDIDFEGSSFLRGTVLSTLRDKIAKLHVEHPPFRVEGAKSGDQIVVAWM